MHMNLCSHTESTLCEAGICCRLALLLDSARMETRASSVTYSVLLQDTDECSVEQRPSDAGEFGAVVQWRLSHRQALWAGLWREAGWGVQGVPATEGPGWNAWNGRLTVARSEGDCRRFKELLMEMWSIHVQTDESIHEGFWFVLVYSTPIGRHPSFT